MALVLGTGTTFCPPPGEILESPGPCVDTSITHRIFDLLASHEVTGASVNIF